MLTDVNMVVCASFGQKHRAYSNVRTHGSMGTFSRLVHSGRQLEAKATKTLTSRSFERLRTAPLFIE